MLVSGMLLVAAVVGNLQTLMLNADSSVGQQEAKMELVEKYMEVGGCVGMRKQNE